MTPKQYADATALLQEKAVLRADIDIWVEIYVGVKDSNNPKIEFKCNNNIMPTPPADEFKRFKDSVVAKLEARLKAVDKEFAAL